ncbi:hypothetical protein SD70_02630 [Gordoniibacillus kamchatkensis]|uniref:DUF3850 domain-containing protein n=1 Tax=Gordoniibacillus kamchatkensis TaxID=1590651 RepID=A0ABR5AMT8_9BACL|nr:hypothetical protein SD70_02630 [Paenibacillus sp. VKM B-2647]
MHELKTGPGYYREVASGRKKFEVRKNDRDFKVGDLLWLREYDPATGYTGEETGRFIVYILNDPQFVKEGYVILGF